MTLVPAETYYSELIAHFQKAQHRILLATMVIYYEPAIKELFTELMHAAKRGVVVTLIFDSYNDYVFTQDFNFFKMNFYRHRLRDTQQWLGQLQAAGVHIQKLGTVGLNPYKGRFHQKVSLIDDRVYFAGGINLTADSFHQVDYMLRIDSRTISDQLAAYYAGNELGSHKDISLPLDLVNKLLLDGGAAGTSVIYERAIALSREARKIIYVSQLAPTGPLAQVLSTKECVLYFNRPSQLISPAWFDQQGSIWRYKWKNRYCRKDFLHAKYMLFEMPSGKTKLLSGSHNFSYRGVRYGTQEIALESSDPRLYSSLQEFIQKFTT